MRKSEVIMPIFHQIVVLALMALAGTVVSKVLPGAIPPSIAGMLILLFLLWVRLIKLEHIEQVARFLLAYMAMFFIPPTVNVAEHLDLLGSHLLQFIAVAILSTIVTFCAALGSAALVIRLQRYLRRKGEPSA